MGITDEGARVVANLVSIVVGLTILVFIGLCGYLAYSCDNEVLNPPATSNDKGR